MSIPTHALRREIRHPAHTPVCFDGSSPILTGTGSNGLNDWQPIGVGDADYLDGASPNQRRFKADAGSKMIISGYSTGETIEDDTGDGDDSLQMRDRSFRVPGGRSISFIVPKGWVWLAPFLNLCKNDRAPKRPFELRETRYEAAVANAAVNLAAGYAVAYEGQILADGADFDDLDQGDLVILDGVATTLYAITLKTAVGITLDRPLVAALMDNDTIVRAAKTVQTVERLLVNGYQENKEPKQVLMIEADCVAYGEATETGLS